MFVVVASDCVNRIREDQGENDIADTTRQPDREKEKTKTAYELWQGDITSEGHYHVERRGPCAQQNVSGVGEFGPRLEFEIV